MTKKLKTINNMNGKELVRTFTNHEIKVKSWKVVYFDEHPERKSEKISELIKKTSTLEDYPEKKNDTIALLWAMHELNDHSYRHLNLANAVWKNIATSCIEITNDLIEEYNCTTSLEKILCETIALNYWKLMTLSQKFNWVMNTGKYLSDERTRYLWMLSKELDRVNRSYITALNNLIEIKRPQMNISVKTKNAYFWQNQQFNNNNKEDENIKD